MPTTELQERDRARIDDKYKWNLDEVYPSIAAWRADKDRIAAALPVIRTFAGRLGSSAQVLADALDTTTNLEKELSRLYVYASMLSDQDTRAPEPQGMTQEMQLLFAEFSAQASYMEPEILSVGGDTIDSFLANGASPECLRILFARYRTSSIPYADRCRRENPRGCRAARRFSLEHLWHPLECRLPLPDSHS